MKKTTMKTKTACEKSVFESSSGVHQIEFQCGVVKRDHGQSTIHDSSVSYISSFCKIKIEYKEITIKHNTEKHNNGKNILQERIIENENVMR